MRIVRRRLLPGEVDHELIWFGVSICAAVLAAIWFGLRLPWPRCPFLALTGWPCATCGATRSAIAFLHGDFAQSWQWNPLAFLAFCGVAVFDLYAAAMLVSRAKRVRMEDWSRVEKNAARIAVVTLLAANWIYLLSQRGRF